MQRLLKDQSMQFRRILFPTDFSAPAQAACDCAAALAEQLHADLHLLHVLEHHATTTPQFGMGLALPSRTHESREAVEKQLAQVLCGDRDSGGSVVRAVLDGPPAASIVQYAREQAIDLIVLGTHGRTGLAHVLAGSVADQVVRLAPCPTLIVRPAALAQRDSTT